MSAENCNTISNSEKQLLQQRLIADLCEETITKLQIFQRGLRLNAPIIVPTTKMVVNVSVSQNKNVKKEKIEKEKQREKNMLDERVLNAIKIDKELDTLIGIFSIASLSSSSSLSSSLQLQNTNNDGEKTLKELIAQMQANDNDVDLKTRELRQKQTTMQSLKTQIETGTKASIERLKNMDERIATLRHNLRNVRRLNDLEFDLVERWEANRFTQAKIVTENEEHLLRTEIENLNRQITGEARIINEVEKFNAKQFEEYRAKINEWKTKYANKMSEVNAETLEHEKRIMELTKIQQRHEQTYAERVDFVREYLAKKAEEQRLYEQQMHRVECAIKLQAWWRGVMVRRGLGPYKKKVKKGKKGKGKGK